LVEVVTDLDTRPTVRVDVRSPDDPAGVVDDALHTAPLVRDDVVAGTARRVCVDARVVHEEHGDHRERVGVHVDAKPPVGEDLCGEPVSVPVVGPVIAIAGALPDSSAEGIVVGVPPPLLAVGSLPEDRPELVAGVVVVGDRAVGARAAADVVSVVVVELLGTCVAKPIALADGGLPQGGGFEERTGVVVSVGVPASVGVSRRDETVCPIVLMAGRSPVAVLDL
jgi:hypothetical protein